MNECPPRAKKQRRKACISALGRWSTYTLAGCRKRKSGRRCADNLLVRRRWTGTYTILGTEGTIEVPRAEDTCHRGTRCRCGCDGNRREELFEPVNQYKYMVDAFSESVLNRQPVPSPTGRWAELWRRSRVHLPITPLKTPDLIGWQMIDTRHRCNGTGVP